MSAFYREKVLSVRHWTDTLFSFRATRDTGFRFQNGQFAMIGLEVPKVCEIIGEVARHLRTADT